MHQQQIWAGASALDRAELLRKDDAWLAGAWGGDTAWLVLTVGPGKIVVDAGGMPVDAHRGAPFDPDRHYFLGLLDDRAIFTTPVTEETLPSGARPASLRSLIPALDDAWADVVVTATAITQWHHLDPYCPGCGSATRVTDGGFARWCDTDQRFTFPRNDPAVIVAVLDAADRVLLGHQGTWPPGRASVLAGFVESGESLEQAVHREMGEEAGVALERVTYAGSQPWPFPRSLMVGFFARVRPGERIGVDGHEITDADWFTRDQVARVLRSGPTPQVRLGGAPVSLPGPGTIARRLLEAWLDGVTA